SKLWEPKNASGRFSYENMTMRAAFARSNNIIAVKVGNDERVGVKSVAQTAHAMGIKSDLKETPSLCLGASDVNLLELVNSYGTVVNEGQPKTPVLVTKIIKKGEEKPIFESKRDIKDPSQSGSLDESQAYSMRRMLEAVCSDAGGTGQALNQYVSGVGIGGKTGTSNNYADAWFVAITPNLVCGAWVGGQYRQIHFRTAQGQGSRAALPIVGLFLKKVMGDKDFAKYRKKFTPKPELDRVIMACSNTVGPSTNVDSIQHDPYEPYSDSLPYTNSADGTTKSMQEIASEDINGLNGNTGSNNTGAEKPEEKSTGSPASRVERAFENRSNP
ncbi:MAG: penicillin-binding protein, partial [Muribaculaceae bacterium]|nr:penicillin-binding protein [Muribaculaceae bacterium]